MERGGPPGIYTKDIALTKNSVDALTHRGRKRFRRLKLAHDAEFTLMPDRMVLRVTGRHDCIVAVEREVDALNSMLVPVSRELWDEMMTSRTTDAQSENHIRRLEALCGCRIHVERYQYAVRFFGRLEDVLVGIDALGALAGQFPMHDRQTTVSEADIVRDRIRARDLVRAGGSSHHGHSVSNASSNSAGARSVSASETWQSLGTSSGLTCSEALSLPPSLPTGSSLHAEPWQCPQASTVLGTQVLPGFAADMVPAASEELTLITRFSF